MTQTSHDSLAQLFADLRALGWNILAAPDAVKGIGIKDGIAYVRVDGGTWNFTVPMYVPEDDGENARI